MKKIFAGILMSVLLVYGSVTGIRLARAGITCSLPFQLQNNTTADATQVMANYNALVTCFTNAAAAGVNNDITALTALTTPLTPVQGGSTVYIGGTSTGTANAQVVATVSPTGFTLTAGNRVTWLPGASNTGATTINVAGQGVKQLSRRTQIGPGVMVGGELIIGQQAEAVYDGTNFQLLSAGPDLIGEIRDYTGTVPAGWQAADNSCLSQTTYGGLFAVISTSWGSCSAGNFAVPDLRARVTTGVDAGGTGRLSGCSATTLTTTCGAQNVTLTQANLPSGVNLGPGSLAGALASSTVSGSVTFNSNTGNTPGGAANTIMAGASGGSGTTSTSASVSLTVSNQAVNISGTVSLGGSSTPAVTVQPSIFVNKMIKL